MIDDNHRVLEEGNVSFKERASRPASIEARGRKISVAGADEEISSASYASEEGRYQSMMCDGGRVDWPC